jgi:ABC-2 type transport system ATP-binding protein
MSFAIATEDLSRRFGRVEAVRNLSLQVPSGVVYAFLGPNGAGKTTTINLLMNLIRPSAGRAEILGVDSRRLDWRSLASIGYVSENQKLPHWMTIGDFLDFCGQLYPNWDGAYCRELLDRFELPRNHRIGQCSRGMRMKAALISSLAYRPALLVLDEPFSGLDPNMRDDMALGMRELASEGGRTVFLSSHDLAEVETLADYIGFLRDGRLRAAGRLSDMQQRFQRIEVNTGAEIRMTDWPSGWLQLERLDGAVRFIDSEFSSGETPRRLRERFGEHASWQATPLSLRQIFQVLGKAPRREDRPS